MQKLSFVQLAAEGLPENAINLVEDTSRDTATQMMKLNGYLDVLITDEPTAALLLKGE